MMVGWANYFCLGPVSRAYQVIERHARRRLRQWLCSKHKIRWPATKRYPEAALHQKLGLVQLRVRGQPAFRGRPRDTFSESRMREMRLFGSMSGCSDASWCSSGKRPARGNCPVVSVVISGAGAGDQTVESPEVKVPVGWVKAWSAPTRGASKSTGRSESEP
jgi:hypothetical protein